MNPEHVQRLSDQRPTVWFGRPIITCVLSLLVFFLSAAEETRHTVNVLRSHETPFTKKQQVINHVFGNYSLKMANDQKSTEKAGELELSLQEMVTFSFFL